MNALQSSGYTTVTTQLVKFPNPLFSRVSQLFKSQLTLTQDETLPEVFMSLVKMILNANFKPMVKKCLSQNWGWDKNISIQSFLISHFNLNQSSPQSRISLIRLWTTQPNRERVCNCLYITCAKLKPAQLRLKVSHIGGFYVRVMQVSFLPSVDKISSILKQLGLVITYPAMD